MRTISVKDLNHSDISEVVQFAIPDPVLAGFNTTPEPKITVTGILHGYIKRNIGTVLILEVGSSRYSIDEVWQEVLQISFPGTES